MSLVTEILFLKTVSGTQFNPFNLLILKSTKELEWMAIKPLNRRDNNYQTFRRKISGALTELRSAVLKQFNFDL